MPDFFPTNHELTIEEIAKLTGAKPRPHTPLDRRVRDPRFRRERQAQQQKDEADAVHGAALTQIRVQDAREFAWTAVAGRRCLGERQIRT
jgi:hypothetical protein